MQAHYEQQTDKSVYRIPYLSAVEVCHLPVGAFKAHDLELHIERCPAFAPGETLAAVIRVKNLQQIAQTIELCPQAEGFVCETAAVGLEAGEEKTVALKMTAPAEKRPLTRGFLEVRRTLSGVYWNSEFLPLSMLPTMDWKWEAGGKTGLVRLAENRIAASQLPAADTIVLETTLSLEDAGAATLKLACANPLKVWLDGELLIDCPERTVVIPAYHRADARKCASLPEGPGRYALRIEIDDARSFEELFFMVVSPELYWAYRLDSMFCTEG